MYKALCNIFQSGKEWKKGETYSEAQIKELDKTDFEKVEKETTKKTAKKK